MSSFLIGPTYRGQCRVGLVWYGAQHVYTIGPFVSPPVISRAILITASLNYPGMWFTFNIPFTVLSIYVAHPLFFSLSFSCCTWTCKSNSLDLFTTRPIPTFNTFKSTALKLLILLCTWNATSTTAHNILFIPYSFIYSPNPFMSIEVCNHFFQSDQSMEIHILYRVFSITTTGIEGNLYHHSPNCACLSIPRTSLALSNPRVTIIIDKRRFRSWCHCADVNFLPTREMWRLTLLSRLFPPCFLLMQQYTSSFFYEFIDEINLLLFFSAQ